MITIGTNLLTVSAFTKPLGLCFLIIPFLQTFHYAGVSLHLEHLVEGFKHFSVEGLR